MLLFSRGVVIICKMHFEKRTCNSMVYAYVEGRGYVHPSIDERRSGVVKFPSLALPFSPFLSLIRLSSHPSLTFFIPFSVNPRLLSASSFCRAASFHSLSPCNWRQTDGGEYVCTVRSHDRRPWTRKSRRF